MPGVALLGLGRMGREMAGRLAAAEHLGGLVVWNRSRAVAEAFAAEHPGVSVADTPAVAAAALPEDGVVLTVLADDTAVRDVVLGAEVPGNPGVAGRAHGVLHGARPGVVVVDLSTVAPTTTADVARALAAAGATLVDAPVSGSVATARAGGLTVMAGGDAAALAVARPVLEVLAARVLHVGPSGAGAATKLAVNTVLHGLNAAVSEALVLAERAGVGREAAYEVLLHSAVAAPYVHYKQRAFERPEGEPVAFRLGLAAKDLRLALDLADRVGAGLPQARSNLTVLDSAVGAGLGDSDLSALAVHLRRVADGVAGRSVGGLPDGAGEG